MGAKSGRDGDKIAEAELVFECRKIYWDDLNPTHFLDPAIEKNYPAQDYHRAYFGEIVAAFEGDMV